ncbi:MAG: UDP-N-acetylmuramoyl-L-alanyl-D-glutamate--2,6-diaminopimelate ligase [Leptospiraceae bacterium]|nr:UDP-N-acetylmuramoyl-L-alanyl-D-glutamate--2,6-diaminopimelate ligase [Leptospiraceae bacterium]MDW7975745.1 UDP-N-acetylmuramoyl-L-alanyl-D-glutamate--2,6-diaminopimelate ligase [Leptospiraceae bacterium]
MDFDRLISQLKKRFPNHIQVFQIENHKAQELLILPKNQKVELTDDTRRIQSNSFYFSTHFAKPYLSDAISKKPFAMFLSRKELRFLTEHGGYQGIVVIGKRIPDFYLGHASSIYYEDLSQSLNLIAITGTNGKTTTSFMIYHLWKKKNLPCAVVGTLGIFYWDGQKEMYEPSGFTTPRAYELQKILKYFLDKNIKNIVIEASSEALALRRLEGLHIQKAVFTTFGRDHLNFHMTLSAYFFAKLHLFFLTLRTSKQRMFIVVPQDQTKILFQKFEEKTKCSIHYLKKEELNSPFVKNQPFPVKFNQWNALCAFYATQNLYNLNETPLEDFPNVPGRLQKISVNAFVDAIIDYAHTPDALEVVLKELRNFYANIIVVFGCGGNRDREKRPQMGSIAERLSDLVILTDDNPRDEDPEFIRQEIKAGIKDFHKVLEIGDRKNAIITALKIATEMNQKPVCVLVAGKGHEEYQIIKKQKLPFSDKQVVLEYLNSK